MREMILNHASVAVFDSDSREATECLCDVVGGMRQLVWSRVAGATLRTTRYWGDVRCQPGYSLHDVLRELRRRHRDEHSFFVRLAAKSPFLAGIEQSVRDRLALCEEKTLSKKEGQPLVLGALADGVLVGFPSEPRWDCDQLAVEFVELLPDETFVHNTEEVDQLTRLVHAENICARHQSRLTEEIGNDPRKLLENLRGIFPYLQFGPDVESQLESEANHLPVIIKKLTSLNQSGRVWGDTGGAVPPWNIKVTPESEQVMNNQALRDGRRFRSQSGSTELFEWHARFGGGGRIHLRFVAETRVIEIGYIGPHLPL